MRSFDEIVSNKRIIVTKRASDGIAGEIYMPKWRGSIIASNGAGWNHVSVTPYKHTITPTWDDMCMIKDICFADEEWVMQLHPAKSEYVNNMPNCLHLWEPNDGRTIPTPPSILTGVK